VEKLQVVVVVAAAVVAQEEARPYRGNDVGRRETIQSRAVTMVDAL